MNMKHPSEIKPKARRKRKWPVILGVIVVLLLLLPAAIGMLVRSSIDQQLALQNQKAVWNAGWLSSQMTNVSPSGIATKLNFRHGPFWLNPPGAGITAAKGSIQLPSTSELPLTANVGLNGQFQVQQIIPVAYTHKANGEWSTNQVSSNAFLQLQSTIGSSSINAEVRHPQGLLRQADWQLSWQDLLSQLAIDNTQAAYEDGSLTMQAKRLRWQPLMTNTEQLMVHQLNGKLNWPQDQDIRLQFSASNISFIGQQQQSGELQVQVDAVSIDRIALIQWLQARQQNSLGQSPTQILALASMLAAQPELHIRRASLETPQGLIQLNAQLRFKPNQRQAQITGDMPHAAAQWLAQAIFIDQQIAESRLKSLIQDGWLRRSDNQLILDLTVNL